MVIRSSAPVAATTITADVLCLVPVARIGRGIGLGAPAALSIGCSDVDALGSPWLAPKLVQQNQVFVDGTSGLDDGGIFQGRPEDPGAGVAVLWVVMMMMMMVLFSPLGRRRRRRRHGAAAVDEVDDQAGRCRCQLDDRGVGEVGPIGAVGVLAAALRETLDVESEKAAVVGNVVAEPRVDRVRIVRVRDGDGITLRSRGSCCCHGRIPRGFRILLVVVGRRWRKRWKGPGGGEVFIRWTRCESITFVFDRRRRLLLRCCTWWSSFGGEIGIDSVQIGCFGPSNRGTADLEEQQQHKHQYKLIDHTNCFGNTILIRRGRTMTSLLSIRFQNTAAVVVAIAPPQFSVRCGGITRRCLEAAFTVFAAFASAAATAAASQQCRRSSGHRGGTFQDPNLTPSQRTFVRSHRGVLGVTHGDRCIF